MSNHIELFNSAIKGDRRSLSKLLTAIESGQSISGLPNPNWTLGITGPPGVGKSTLIGRMIQHWSSSGEKVAILAVDPSSPISGGSILADRVRMGEASLLDSVLIRSLATRNHPGGILPYLGQMCSILSECGWTRVLIETVGSGQSEIGIVAFADRILLVDGPDRGDIVQSEKAGIMELADIIAINKADLSNSKASFASVIEALSLGEDEPIPVHLVSAFDGTGVEGLIAELEALQPSKKKIGLRQLERLIANWNSLLLTHPQIDSHIENLCEGSITIREAITSMGTSMDFGGDVND